MKKFVMNLIYLSNNDENVTLGWKYKKKTLYKGTFCNSKIRYKYVLVPPSTIMTLNRRVNDVI